MYRIKCAEVWGGSRAIDNDVCTSGVTASVFSAAGGGAEEKQSGGDIYYFSLCSHDAVTRIALADVVGHGAAASVVSGWLYDALLKRIEETDGDGVLGYLNRIAHERGLEAMTTAAVLTFYTENSNLYFSYAGHPPLLLQRRKNESEWREMGVNQSPNPSNLPLGILGDTTYDQNETALESGDRILLYTDGVTEMMNAQGELFGLARLIEVLKTTDDCSLAEIKQKVRQAALDHADGNAEQDDFTLIAVEVN